MKRFRLLFLRFFAVLAFFSPITSVLLLPSVQGTTPGYLLSLTTLPLVAWFGGRRKRVFFKTIFFIFAVWFALFVFSQLNGLLWGEKVYGEGLVLIDPSDQSSVLRGSIFTQSIYLAVVALYFSFVYSYYESSWGRYLKYGAVFLAIYGCYEFCYFLVFHENGDFLSNRMFGADMDSSGSSVQTMVVADFWLTRLKSLTGEPSMYAFTMMPFLLYSYSVKWGRLVQVLLMVSVILTASTSAMLAAIVALMVAAWYGRIRGRVIFFSALLIVLVGSCFYEFLFDLFDQVVLAKALGENISGSDRSDTFGAMMEFWSRSGFFVKLVGVGFGVVRSTDFFSTMLVNCGLVGLTLFVCIFLYPVSRLGNDSEGFALKQCLLSTLVVMLVSVPEYAYLSPWTFLALAYRRIR